MVLEKDAPFQAQRTEEERVKDASTVYTIRLNRDEEKQLNDVGVYFQQPKLSTLIKQLALLNASDVLQDKKSMARFTVIMNNVRRNYETGVPVEMPSDKPILGKCNTD